MSWTRFAATISAAVLVGWAITATAADEEYGRSGPYIGAGGVYAFQNFGDNAKKTPDGSGGYNLKGGYRFNEYFALEVDWDQLLGFNNSTGDTDMWLVGADAKFYPFQGILQPFLSVGGAYASVDDHRAPKSSDTGFSARFDAGLDVYLSRNWALTAQAGYILTTGGISDYNAIPITFGVLYRFF